MVLFLLVCSFQRSSVAFFFKIFKKSFQSGITGERPMDLLKRLSKVTGYPNSLLIEFLKKLQDLLLARSSGIRGHVHRIPRGIEGNFLQVFFWNTQGL